ncbi:MAG: 6-carboxytetrahydropterin synthase [Opitutales bacterium]|nr:6-carboxytetrahydropterin synthase [Opitutales bacterium]
MPHPSEIPTPVQTNKSLSGQVVVTRKVHFNAAHRLENTDFPSSWNAEQYGSCNNALWHGHNYTLEVSLKGEPDPQTGYVIDLGRLKTVINEEIVEKCDHRNLNLEVDFLKGIIPSAENLVIAFWRQLEKRLGKGKLFRIRLYETERNFAEFYGE